MGVVMSPDAVSELGELYLDGEFWHFRFRDAAERTASLEEIPHSIQRLDRLPIWVGLATGPKRLTKKEAREVVSAILLSQLCDQTILQRSSITVAEFIERKFAPEFVESKTLLGRLYYQSMLKHIVNPEEVVRIFHVGKEMRKTSLKSVADWPYLGHIPLRDVRSESVQNLTSTALKQGYSTQTAAHIRNVVSTIFDFAKKEMFFSGENPARAVQLPKLPPTNLPHLTHAQMIQLIATMEYPVREITLLSIIVGMNVGEICGLRWKRVNLNEHEIVRSDSEVIPPKTIIVREEWARSQLITVPQRRMSTRKIPTSLLPILRELKYRGDFIEPDDFVFVSRGGNPINPSNVLAGGLKPIARELKIPSLSWRHLRGIRRALLAELGNHFQSQMARLVHAVASHELNNLKGRRCLVETELPYGRCIGGAGR